ncbi:MAG: glycosyltransferase family 4 protein [Fimbriimonadaceae bacterium]|nr:glycosyltransferase family 4 protein [Fimbriimonadaceae bacterium]
MRVIMLSWEYPPRIVGGISPHVYELSQQLQSQGVSVHVVTKETPLAPDEEVEPSGVHVHRVHLDEEPNDFIHEIQLLNAATERRVRRLLEDFRPGGEPTLFHAHDWLSLDSARELKYEYSLPLVATVHATEEGRNQGVHNDTQRYIHEQEYWLTYEAWRVIVCSQFMRGEVERLFSCPADKVDVIFNGVDASKFEFEWTEAERAAWRAKFALPEERIVVYVGRFVREKGIQNLLNAAGAVLAREPNTKFLIVGGGHRERFERFVRWYGLKEKVLFTGFMANRSLHQVYRIADVAAFPSLYEPFGIVALEGMAAGAPVVTSDAGGLSEVVLHDETGTLSYANNSESLAWAILRVLEDPVRAARLAKAAKLRLQTDFNWERIAKQTVGTYERVWAEFLQSYWADQTLWPVTPGAEERAARRNVREKASTGRATQRPRPPVSMPRPPATLDHEENPPN